MVEDDFLILMELESTLTAAGAQVIGPSRSVDDALALAGELPPSSRGGLVSRLVSWRDALSDRPNRLVLRDTLALPETVILQDGRTPWLPTPIPALRPTAEQHLR